VYKHNKMHFMVSILLTQLQLMGIVITKWLFLWKESSLLLTNQISFYYWCEKVQNHDSFIEHTKIRKVFKNKGSLTKQ
jgi:hypothetical protein